MPEVDAKAAIKAFLGVLGLTQGHTRGRLTANGAIGIISNMVAIADFQQDKNRVRELCQ